MEGCTDMVVDESFVIHVLDNRLPAAQCSGALTPLPDGLRAALTHYLLSLLKPGLRRKRYGRFRAESAVLHAYQRLTAAASSRGGVDQALFLEVSQRLAALLFAAMRQTPENGGRPQPGTITPGDLLVGMFHSRAPEASATPYLFLIKVDLETALQRQIRPLAAGGIQTVLAPCDGLLPKFTAAHVHKTALIRFQDDAATYDVLMTDPQGGKDGVARFFAEDFLHSEPFRTAEEQAELLFMRTRAWVTAHEEALSPHEQQQVLQSVRTLVTERAARAEPVLPRDLVLSLPLSEPRPQEATQELRRSLQATLTLPQGPMPDSIPPDRELLLHAVPPWAASRRVTYQLDEGVQLSGDQEAIARLFLQPPHRVGERTEFTIRTTTFRPLV